jgi:hypothetical protein
MWWLSFPEGVVIIEPHRSPMLGCPPRSVRSVERCNSSKVIYQPRTRGTGPKPFHRTDALPASGIEVVRSHAQAAADPFRHQNSTIAPPAILHRLHRCSLESADHS